MKKLYAKSVFDIGQRPTAPEFPQNPHRSRCPCSLTFSPNEPASHAARWTGGGIEDRILSRLDAIFEQGAKPCCLQYWAGKTSRALRFPRHRLAPLPLEPGHPMGLVFVFWRGGGMTVCAFATQPAARESPIAWQRLSLPTHPNVYRSSLPAIFVVLLVACE